MGQTANSEADTAPEIDAFRERVRELREKLERAQGAQLDMPAPGQPAPTPAPKAAVSRPQAQALPAAIEQRMIEATQRIEQLAARETDLTNLLRRTRAELDASERRQEEALEALRIAEDRASAAGEDTEQAKAVADGLRQQVDAQRRRIEALGAENRALQERNSRIAGELQSAGQRESAARDELKRLQATFDALQVSYDEVRRQKVDLESNLTRTSSRINEFETELMGQLSHLESEYARIEQEAGGARREADEAAAARDKLAEDEKVKDALLAELRDELEAERGRRAEEVEKRRDIDARLESLQGELAGLQSRYAADLVELDAARQSSARFEKRASDLTDELQAQRELMQHHEAAFAKMDSLFRSLDSRSSAPAAPAAPSQAAERPLEALQAAAQTHAAPVPLAVTTASATSARVAPSGAQEAPVAPQRVATAMPQRVATVRARRPERAAPAAPSAPKVDTSAASATARERLGKSLEALQALAEKHKVAERNSAPAARETSAPAAPRTVRVAAAPVTIVEEPSAATEVPATKDVGTPRPVVKAPPVETPAPTAETRDGFIMPKPRLIRRD